MLIFVLNSILLGIGLAMDAFSVSVATSLSRNKMPSGEALITTGMFGFAQGLMPLLGWIILQISSEFFSGISKITPWISLILLLFIGGDMIIKELIARKKGGDISEGAISSFSFKILIIQTVATSIDALSVGFTISNYSFLKAFTASLIIAVVTFVICLFGIGLGKKIGAKFSSFATILGGIILIFVGIEIFVNGIA